MQMRFEKKQTNEQILKWMITKKKKNWVMWDECVILGTKSIFLDSSFANNGFCFSISILFHDGCPLIKLLPFKQ